MACTVNSSRENKHTLSIDRKTCINLVIRKFMVWYEGEHTKLIFF